LTRNIGSLNIQFNSICAFQLDYKQLKQEKMLHTYVLFCNKYLYNKI